MAVLEDNKDKKHLADLERLKNFRLFDDDFMTKCFDGETACIEFVLRIVLDKPDLQVLEVHTQVFMANLLKRSVRFDVLATDSQNIKYNIEIQREDKGAGERRARYNSSMLDANMLSKGENFSDLPETYVIFITENDVFGKGLPLYSVNRYIAENGDIFNDGAHILYVNGAYRGDTPLGKLMYDFSCSNPADMNYAILAERVKFFKENNEGVAIMCRAIEEMRAQERQEEKREVACRMLSAGKYTLDEIANISGLAIDEIKQLQTEKSA